MRKGPALANPELKLTPSAPIKRSTLTTPKNLQIVFFKNAGNKNEEQVNLYPQVKIKNSSFQNGRMS